MLTPPELPERLTLARLPTPMRLLEKLSARVKSGNPHAPDIWLKCDDQTGSVLSGNKVRKLEYLLADAKAQGATTVITCGGLQSNHCRATAIACAQVNLQCVLILRSGDVERSGGVAVSRKESNLFLDQLVGAQIRIVDKEQYLKQQLALFQEEERKIKAAGGIPYSIPTGGSNGVGVWGYLQASRELEQDCQDAGITPGAIICASGSGGTQAGLSLGTGFWQASASVPQVIGFAVCDSSAYFHRKASKDIKQWARIAGYDAEQVLARLSINTIDDYIGPGYAIPYPAMVKEIATLAREEGVVLDPVYTGKAFYGMLQEIAAGRFDQAKEIIFVHTGGVYGLFPYADEFLTADA